MTPNGFPDAALVLVTGKGGVGKSTIAAALATWAVEEGRRTVLVEVSAHAASGAFFPDPPAPGEPPKPLAPSLHGVVLNHDGCLRAYLEEHLDRARLIRTILSHPVALTFLRAAPSVTEVTTLNRIVQLADDPRFDTVVVDLPAYGHAYQMLRAPQTIASMVRGGVVTGPSERIVGLLRSPGRAALVAVTLPEEMPVSETLEHAAKIRSEVGIETSMVVLNQAVSPLRSEAAADPGKDAALLDDLLDATQDPTLGEILDQGRIRARAADQTESFCRTLIDGLGAPLVRVPVVTAAADAADLLSQARGALQSGLTLDEGIP